MSDVIAARTGTYNPDFERIVCIHEAGHAIVFSKLGFAVEFVDADKRGSKSDRGLQTAPRSL